MHKFMQTIGSSMYQKRQDMEKLLQHSTKGARKNGQLSEREGNMFRGLRVEAAPGMDVTMASETNPEGTFNREYYLPYMKSTDISSDAKYFTQRHMERETFTGLLDEYRVGISPTFYIGNSIEYRLRRAGHKPIEPSCTVLLGLYVQDRIFLPIQKTEKQAEDSRMVTRKRNNLLGTARRGDENAVGTLAIEDIDLYSMVSRQVVHEGVYFTIETCFMPCGIGRDQYSIIEETIGIELSTSRVTKGKVYGLALDCSDMAFHVIINRQDLLGELGVDH